MPRAHEPRSFTDAAEHAAAAGDYVSAERLLREAARLQEADFGPLHPDLANTLNNLGIVCEITNKPADAEVCYRRACAIATAVLEPDHPFAATSRKNLGDFCEARGKPVDSPMALPAQAAGQELHVVVLSLCGVVSVMLIATSLWLRSNGKADPSAVSATSAPTEISAPTRGPAEPTIVPKEVTTNNRGPVAATTMGRGRAASAPAPTLVSAGLCRDLSTGGSRGFAGDWRCDPASRPVASGALFFYTRLKSPHDTTVQHRWYRRGRLSQAVDLRIRANQDNGYRTYSRYTMNSRSAGDWSVELRSGDGLLLHEERFVVR
jgi:hypothetical protein